MSSPPQMFCAVKVFADVTCGEMPCAGPCAAGYFCAPGSTSPAPSACPIGYFSLSGSEACLPCPAGTYGSRQGESSSSCGGSCLAGYVCLEGSSSPTQYACPAGSYSLPGSQTCSVCEPGRYGEHVATGTAGCSGPCAPGRFGSRSGAVASQCEGESTVGLGACVLVCLCAGIQFVSSALSMFVLGACSPGYACPAGSTSATNMLCPPGRYSLTGSESCAPCAAGRYSSGSARGMECADVCPAGHECPLASLSASLCAVGKFSPSEGSEACAVCLAAPGYFCPAGSTSALGVACAEGYTSAGGSDSCHEPPSSGPPLGPIVGGVIGALLVATASVFTAKWLKRRRAREGNPVRTAQGSGPLDVQVEGDLTDLREFPVETVRRALVGLESIAEGGSAEVFRTQIHGRTVAVKAIRTGSMASTYAAGFRQEISILGSCRHPNVVELVGYSTEPDTGSLWLVYVAYGSGWIGRGTGRLRCSRVLRCQGCV